MCATVFASPHFGHCADVLPYFKPTPEVFHPVDPMEPARVYGPSPAHPVAQECAIDDVACIERHDTRVLDAALFDKTATACGEATHPDQCEAAYHMIAGEVEPLRWAGLDDPCTFVVRVDGGVAQLYSPRTFERRRAPVAPGWKAAMFLGRCDLGSISTATNVSADVLLPQFPWQGKGGVR